MSRSYELPILLDILKKCWRPVTEVILVLVLLCFLYFHVKDIGYNEAKVKYEKEIAEYNKKLDDHISTIERNSTILVQNQADTQSKLDAGIDQIISVAGKKPLYIVKQDKCIPSQNFLDSYNDVINKANGK